MSCRLDQRCGFSARLGRARPGEVRRACRAGRQHVGRRSDRLRQPGEDDGLPLFGESRCRQGGRFERGLWRRRRRRWSGRGQGRRSRAPDLGGHTTGRCRRRRRSRWRTDADGLRLRARRPRPGPWQRVAPGRKHGSGLGAASRCERSGRGKLLLHRSAGWQVAARSRRGTHARGRKRCSAGAVSGGVDEHAKRRAMRGGAGSEGRRPLVHSLTSVSGFPGGLPAERCPESWSTSPAPSSRCPLAAGRDARRRARRSRVAP